jgi:hypothetical protein
MSATPRTSRLPATFSALTSHRGLRRVLLAFAMSDVVGMAVWLAISRWAYAATVTSLTAGRLLVVTGHDFLAAVTGSSDGQAIAAEVQAAYVHQPYDAGPG